MLAAIKQDKLTPDLPYTSEHGGPRLRGAGDTAEHCVNKKMCDSQQAKPLVKIRPLMGADLP